MARPMANERQTAPQSDIKLLISKGLEQGYLTYAEVNDHLPDDMVDPEQIEDIIGMINGMGIEVHEIAPDAETLLLAGSSAGGREVDDTAAEEAAATLSALDAEGGRTTDPVRMYMREMGHGRTADAGSETEIAKRIGGRASRRTDPPWPLANLSLSHPIAMRRCWRTGRAEPPGRLPDPGKIRRRREIAVEAELPGRSRGRGIGRRRGRGRMKAR